MTSFDSSFMITLHKNSGETDAKTWEGSAPYPYIASTATVTCLLGVDSI